MEIKLQSEVLNSFLTLRGNLGKNFIAGKWK